MELSSRPRALVALLQTQKNFFFDLVTDPAWIPGMGEKGKEEKKGEEKDELRVWVLAKNWNIVSFGI